MRQTWKEKANQVLSNMGQKIPVSRTSGNSWGEVELPACLRAELEGSDSAEEE
jgi:hypothetical protein